ncbi:hypothetical protein KEM52_006121 [Ascosphaera acerosa]|nr:hypothetical protein KEM52_006121 [Ascosphaera acerosa]
MLRLDDIRKAKIKEYFQTAEVKAKEKPKPVAPPPAKKAAPKAAPGGGKKVVKRAAAAPGGVKKPAPTDLIMQAFYYL